MYEYLSETVMETLQAETNGIFTTDEESFRIYRAQELTTLQRARSIVRLQTLGVFDSHYEVRPVSKMSHEAIIEEKEQIAKNIHRLGPDEFRIEVDTVAIVRGYYILAALRFADRITLTVKSKLIHEAALATPETFVAKNLGLALAGE
ncbi:hypothetical protein KJ359_001718 [Pestalotiopsis sp. 9143b]|nr:hypothetical protein KJ359_001718 [Pestalotiopsis sp. 9143b]